MWKLSKNFGFHRNQCNVQKVMRFEADTSVFIERAMFCYVYYLLLSTSVFPVVCRIKGANIYSGKLI